MLIDNTYFIAELNIPNKEQTATGELIDYFIKKYEAKFLDEVLGYELSKAFQAGIAEAVPEQKWTDIKSGVEYTNLSGKLKKWKGLAPGAPNKTDSPIANYVYYWYMRNNITQTTSMSEVKSKNENAVTVSPSLKLVRAWNEMSKCIYDLVDFLNSNKETYTEWESQDVYCMLNKFRPINEFSI